MILTYTAAAVGGMTLVIGFLNFNGLHKEFLEANFDSVHGARTLLKARFLINQAARDIDTTFVAPNQRDQLLQTADKRLLNAQHYSAEGKDSDPKTREELVTRISNARSHLDQLRRNTTVAESNGALNEAATSLHDLARDIDIVELDRWGTLSGLNKQLAERMRTLNQLMVAAFFLFVTVMATLAWALLRTRRAESALQFAKSETEAIQQTTLDAAPMGIAYVDTSDLENRRITNANRQMADMFGYPPDMMLGLSVRRLYASHDTYPLLSTTAPGRLAAGEVIREEVVMQRRTGMPFWCALSIKAIDPDDISRGVVWTCEDISKRKEAEATILQERTRAEAASQAKSYFLANMSHELRTPFTGLFGLLDLLDNSRLDHNQRRQLGLARSSASQMQSIVNDILDFSKIEAGKLIVEAKPFNLRQLLNEMSGVHTETAQKKGLSFVLDVVNPLDGWLLGDPFRIRQIIDNLISNAFKFTEHGEIRLTVQTKQRGLDSTTLTVMVEDTGIGIPVDDQASIFDKFTQANSSTTRLYGGTGLGLAICKQLATLMGGKITLSSSEAQGSRFTLTLPLGNSAPIETRPPLKSQTPRRKRLDNIVILVAEDNQINRSMLVETLELMGAVVWEAENGDAAVRMAAKHKPDVVLMDCQMPEVDGFDATRQIRAMESPGKRMPIIAITAFATNTHRDQCLVPGMMDGFAPKPLNTEALVNMIRDLLAADQPAPPANTGRILLVDDNLPILEATQALIKRIGYDAVTASSGGEALRLLEAARNDSRLEIDLVLLDCQMPLMDGWETTRRWRQRERELSSPPIAIIATTADDNQETIERCKSAGMNETIHKPFTEAHLHAMLSDWLH